MRRQRPGRIGIERHQLVLAWIAEGRTASEIADELVLNPETIQKFARRHGLKCAPVLQTMENHPAWKGGTRVQKGYLCVMIRRDDPTYGYLLRVRYRDGKMTKTGAVAVHRMVMHNKLGRRLEPGEVVDHIDGNTLNNDPENLRLFATNADHLRETLRGRVPKWTEDGLARMAAGVQRGVQTRRLRALQRRGLLPEPTGDHPRSDDPASPEQSYQKPAPPRRDARAP